MDRSPNILTMATFTRLQVVWINEVSKYHSTCQGVFYTKATNRWMVKFKVKDKPEIHLGFFDTEKEAIQVYTEYHEKYYQEILNQIKKKKDEES
jgi:hypothetical protein